MVMWLAGRLPGLVTASELLRKPCEDFMTCAEDTGGGSGICNHLANHWMSSLMHKKQKLARHYFG